MSEHMEAKRILFEVSETMTLAADRYGNPGNAPILLFHGGGQTRWSWGGTAQQMAQQGLCVYSVDLRGHGESTWCPDGDYLLDHFADDIRAAVKQCDAPPVLVGASLGGMSSLLACGEDPQAACAGLVLVDIAPRVNQGGTDRVGNFLRQTAGGFASLEEAADAVAAYTGRERQSRPEGLLKNLRQHEDGRYRWHWDPAFIAPQQGTWDPDVIEARLMAAARRVEAPALIVRGGKSDVLTEDSMTHLQSALPHVEQAVVKGAGHMIAGDDNSTFNDAVLPFVLKATQPEEGI